MIDSNSCKCGKTCDCKKVYRAAMYTYKAKVIKIVDGDTLDVDIDLGFKVVLTNQRVRLFGIDTPESRTRDLEEKKFGKLAKAFLATAAPVGEYINLKSHERGKFGRILGSLYNDEDALSINMQMVEEGHAVVYSGQSKEDIKQAHLDNREKLQAKWNC